MNETAKAQYQARLIELGKMSREERHSALQLTDEYELICLARANGIHVPRVRWQLVSRIENASMQAAAQQMQNDPAPAVKPCPVEIIATGLQNLALSAVLGRNPAHHDVTPVRPNLAAMLGQAADTARPFIRKPSPVEVA